ncbi:hypothetical protein F1880_008625 [Penicillium rolfsii]|nr:hypothetical protein F1880_008625 [Penicillium rolfsii]
MVRSSHGASHQTSGSHIPWQKRNELCEFKDISKRPSRKVVRPDTHTPSTNLFIDRLLQNPSERAPLYDEFSVLRADDGRVPSSGLAFFSDKKIDSLAKRLGNPQIRDLVAQIDNAIRMRLLASSTKSEAAFISRNQTLYEQLVLLYHEFTIEADQFPGYFEIVHPVFPFLDRSEFEEQINGSHFSQTLETDSVFCALFHAVMALGCQYHGRGSFQPGVGEAWKLFQTSLSCVGRITSGRESLSNLQLYRLSLQWFVILLALILSLAPWTLTSHKAIFAMNTCSLQIEDFLIKEASRIVLALRYHKSSITDSNAQACQRAFWVVYHIEKQSSFQARSSSFIIDLDVGCPIPPVSESIFEDYNWFLASIRISRMFSIAYDNLFSVTASTQPAASLLQAVDRIEKSLEDWRQLIPPIYRPGEVQQRSILANIRMKEIVIRTHFYYFHFVIAIERMKLHLTPQRHKADESLRTLLKAAKTIVELTSFIDVEPYTPVFILAIMPLSALFILFDFVIHSPTHPETREHLILLDILSGHFSLLEHRSAGSLPGNYLSRFAHIARQYAENQQSQAVASIRNNDSAIVGDVENGQDASSRADNTLRDNPGPGLATATSYHEFNDSLEQESLAEFTPNCDSATEDASLQSTDLWPPPLLIENESGWGALFGSAISWEGLIE